jgi:methionyl-tRNA formyltransferase
MNTKKINWVFFGSSEFSVHVLNELKVHKILPSLIVTTPDKPKGRKLVLAPTPVKVWAQNNNIEVIDLMSKLKNRNFNLFIVASYGKIIPKEIFEIPAHKTLNIHPSLLPKYRGASPIQSQILNDEKEVGVTIMQIDEGMDTGPVVIQREFQISNNKFQILGRKELEKILATEGARLFVHILPEWLMGAIDPIMQDESKATYCQKIKKEDGELKIDLNNLEKNAKENLLKIKAFQDWPTAYFFLNDKRIIITDAEIKDDRLVIIIVKPEGKNEMPFEDFLRGQR